MSHRFSSLLLAASLLTPLVPATALASDIGDVRSMLESAADDLRDLRDDLPATDDEVEDYADDVRAILEDATDELNELESGLELTDALEVRWLGALVENEAYDALDGMALESFDLEADVYLDEREDTEVTLDAFTDAVRAWTKPAIEGACLVTALGTTEAWEKAVDELFGHIIEEANDIRDEASGATGDELDALRRRVRFAGNAGQAATMPLWRLSDDAMDRVEDNVIDLQAALTEIGTANASLSSETTVLKNNLDTRLDNILDDQPEEFGNDWEDDYEDVEWNDNAVLQIHEEQFRETMSNGLVDRAETADSLEEYLLVRRDAANELHSVRFTLGLMNIPQRESAVDDLRDVLEDLSNGVYDMFDALDDGSTGDLDDLDGETDDMITTLLEESAEGLDGWLDALDVDGNASGMMSDASFLQTDFREAVDVLAAFGIVRGRNGLFQASASVTRFEFVKMLFGATCNRMTLSTREVSSTLARFSDSAPAGEVANTMAKAVEDGVLSGNAGMLKVNSPITRFEAAKILVNTYGLSHATAATNFSDVVSGSEQAKYIATATKAGFFNASSSDGRFRPNDPLSRGEAAKIIHASIIRQGASLTTNDPDDIDVDDDLFDFLLDD